MADRVGAGRRRRAAGASHPDRERHRRVTRSTARRSPAARAARRGCPSRGCSRRPGSRARRPAPCSTTGRCSSPPRSGSASTTPDAIARRVASDDQVPPLGRVLDRAAARRAVGSRPGSGRSTRPVPVSETSPTFGPPVPRSTARTNRSSRSPAGARARRSGQLFGSTVSWLSIMSAMTDADELVGLLGQPADHAAVDRAGLRGLGRVLLGVRDRVGEIGGERVRDAGLGLRPGHRHVDRVRVLLAVEPPAAGPHEVVDVVDVELVRA